MKRAALRLQFIAGAASAFAIEITTLLSSVAEELFVYTLEEAQVLVEQWRQIYNKVRPHSALGYRPPAPEAIGILPAMSTQWAWKGGVETRLN